MRIPLALAALLLVPSAAAAQSKARAAEETDTLVYLVKLHDPESGGFRADAAAKPGLRATSAAVRAMKYLGHPVAAATKDKAADFVMKCYDPKTGAFADAPGGKPDVPTTCIGVMAAVELDVPKEKFRKAMDYVREHAKTFEEVRLGAAAVEAWGVKDCPFDLKPWLKAADDYAAEHKESEIRETGSWVALKLRLGAKATGRTGDPVGALAAAQLSDGGFGRTGATASDMETTYRVMRALYLARERPKRSDALRDFIAKCRNKDGGSGTKPGDASSAGGVYYAAIVTKWLDELEKK
jgi:prenyltransferase beta subunit